MPYTKEDIDHPEPSDGSLAITLKTLSLGLIIFGGVLGNSGVIYTIVKDKRLHRSPYYYMVNLSIADLLRSLICLPFVLATVLHGSMWKYGNSGCNLLAFSSTFFMFGALFALFILAVDRHLSVVHTRFHNRRFRGLMCLAIVLIGWGVAFLIAFPPVFGLGTYKFIPMEAQCTFEHRYYKDNDTLGFLLIFLAIATAIIFVYCRIFLFLRSHRRMRPILYQPARSDNWTFFGPGANGLAMANWLNGGFARAPTNMNAFGQPNQPISRTFLSLRTVKNERLTRMFVAATGIFDIAWIPYLILSFWYVFDHNRSISYLFVTIATWCSYMQVALLPLAYIICDRSFRRCMSAHVYHPYVRREGFSE